MHVGQATIFQNPGKKISDFEVYQHELRMAKMVEGLGFDSIWTVEHHFTDYTMCPDVTQFLSYMAGCTQHIKLGSMVIILPWHNPIRVAEEIAMLDCMSDGRMILGLGRGLGRVEFEGFGVPMGESRARFTEYADMVINSLETGYAEYDGQFLKQPRRDIRPTPPQTFKGRTYAAAVSPESSRIMAQLGIGLLVIPQKSWDDILEEMQNYQKIFLTENGTEAPPPLVAGWTFCDENPDRAYEMARKYIGDYYISVLKHYEMAAGHFKTTEGYEYYDGVTKRLNSHGDQDMIDFFMNLQVWGTPEQCYEKIMKTHASLNQDGFIGVFSYSGMPFDEAERNMRLFAKKVMPELKKVSTPSATALQIAV